VHYLLTAKRDRKAAKRFLLRAIKKKYLNNIIEQDHRPIKHLCRATSGFKRFRTVRITIGGFESIRIIRKQQVNALSETSAEIFYSLAA
jgi:transposase-like protein